MRTIKNHKQGFTLIELLIVVLIIGILASIAMPQYQLAVTKAKVVSILPLMRSWKNALQLYKLQSGSYLTKENREPDADTLGVNFPADWECDNEEKTVCHSEEWNCIVNDEAQRGEVICDYKTILTIEMFQVDDDTSCGADAKSFSNKIICMARDHDELGEKICKNMGKLVEGCSDEYVIGG